MFAVLAVVAFLLALIFHLAGGTVAPYVLTAELAGLALLAAHFAAGGGWPWQRRQP